MDIYTYTYTHSHNWFEYMNLRACVQIHACNQTELSPSLYTLAHIIMESDLHIYIYIYIYSRERTCIYTRTQGNPHTRAKRTFAHNYTCPRNSALQRPRGGIPNASLPRESPDCIPHAPAPQKETTVCGYLYTCAHIHVRANMQTQRTHVCNTTGLAARPERLWRAHNNA